MPAKEYLPPPKKNQGRYPPPASRKNIRPGFCGMHPEMWKLFQGSSLVLSGYYFPGGHCGHGPFKEELSLLPRLTMRRKKNQYALVILNDTVPWIAKN